MKRTFLSIVLIALSAAISFAENPSVLYMIGGATPGNWDWAKATEMMPVSGQDGVYSWTGNLSASDFKICVEKDVNWSGTVPFYRPTYANCEISKNGVADNKVVYTTEPDDKWMVKDAGKYTITIDTKDLTLSVVFEGEINLLEGTKALYLLGDMNGWNIDNPLACTKEADNVFVYNGKFEKDQTFQAILTPGSSNWGAAFIVPTVADCAVSPNGVEPAKFDYTTTHANMWKVTETGTYSLKFDLNNWTLSASGNVDTSVVELVTDNDAPVEYYNLQGVRVYEPANGLYLKRKGGKVSKVMIK